MASSSNQQTPSNSESLFGTDTRRDPFWMASPFTRETSTWRKYYKDACTALGFPHVGDLLLLSSSFKPHSPIQTYSAYKSIIAQQPSVEDSSVVIFTISYAQDKHGKLSPDTWAMIVGVLCQVVDPTDKVQLWVDCIDSHSCTENWGIRQLLPYLMFPVVRVGGKLDAGFWSNMEGLAGIFGRGLYHDHSLDNRIIQDFTHLKHNGFLVSRAATWNAEDAFVTFYLHLMYGCLGRYGDHHKEALEAVRQGNPIVNLLLPESNVFLAALLEHERNSVFGNRRFEFLYGDWSKRGNPGWHGLREWLALERFGHPIAGKFERFPINGFVDVYTGEKETVAVVHWELVSCGWTRKLVVRLSRESKEHGKTLEHIRLPGYCQTDKGYELEQERTFFRSSGLSQLYSFDSRNIGWE